MIRHLIAVWPSLIGAVTSQQVLWQVTGSQSYESIGINGALGVGDVDGDGIGDIVSSSRYPSSKVFVVSGATTVELWSFSPTVWDTSLRTFNTGGDIDGDGTWDVAFGVSDYQDPSGNVIGALFLLSGINGAIIRQHTGTINAPLPQWCSGPIIGDADADGFDDYIVLPGGGFVGRADLRSGRTGAILRSWSSSTNGPTWASPIGDVDADGFDDVLLQEGGCAAPLSSCRGAVACYSGATGTLLYRVYGDSTAAKDVIGFRGQVCSGDDLNGDGVPDFVVSSDFNSTTTGLDRGMVRAYSGASGAVLWSRYGASYTRLGVGTSIGDDWNGDGRGDVLAMQWAPEMLHVLSGIDGSDILTYANSSQFVGFGGWRFGPSGDLNGDGYREVLATGNTLLSPYYNPGAIFAIDLQRSGSPAYRQYRGRPCLSSMATMPRMKLAADPRFGATANYRLRGAAPSAVAVMLLGTPLQIDLTALGASGCSLLVDPLWVSPPGFVDQAGMASLPVYVPPVPALAGLSLEAQWGMLDPGANTFGVAFTEAVRCRVGI